MMKPIRALALSLVALAASGCFKQHIKFGRGGDTQRAPDYDQTQFFFVEGLIGDGNLDVSQICRETNDATVVIEQPVQWGFVENCLCGEWVNPHQVKVYCGKKQSESPTPPPSAASQQSGDAERVARGSAY